MSSCLMRVRVTPRSSKNQIVVQGESVRVWVTAAPTDGEANKAACELIAKKLGIAKSSVTVEKGQTSREKTLSIEGLSLEEAIAKLQAI